MTGEELGQKLLQSVREMKAGKAARTTQVAPNEVAAARLKTGLSQSQFAQVLHISARTFARVGARASPTFWRSATQS